MPTPILNKLTPDPKRSPQWRSQAEIVRASLLAGVSYKRERAARKPVR